MRIWSFRNLLCLVAGLWFCMPMVHAQRKSDIRPFHIQHDFRNPDSWFQNDTLFNKQRRRKVNLIAATGYSLATLYVGTQWYAKEDLSSFHFFDDSHEWKQIDKVGHAFSAYNATRWMIGLYKWSGVPKRKAILHGSLVGFMAMNTIEVFDGFGATWGFSWPDVGANLIGTGLAAGNQALWNENRLQMKVSYVRSPYATNPDYQDIFGSNLAEWVLKDYNGQVLWMSCRVHSFLPAGRFKDLYPRWLNLAVGYGADGLVGGYEDPNGEWRTSEYRQWYLSLDIDVANIKTRSGFLNTLFDVVNIIRIPLPAIQFDRNGTKLLPLR
ncbi:DUF2279 domain-containing protein [Pontibacter sp. G13]|uniref:DUF2279 domain-containing protein n=1 Tax=Pontibacter sp. G13 TaxID=3074898 RepID=UPI00288B0CEF|nr:DUF2279 domain-containing protein [Pontibacter sp. G13]WNJ17262.1 DUF2279 domain-containing protein [Pontibacter sp. G13]